MAAIIIFALAFLVRIYNLSLFPLNHDEANWHLGSLVHPNRFLGIPVVYFNGYVHPFFTYLIFLTRKIFSSPEFIVRLPSAVIGLVTVMLIYELSRQMYGKKTGLTSSLLLSFLPWHIIQSRVGVDVILTPLFGCLLSLALFKSILKKSNFWFLLFCFFLSLGSFYTYEASLLFIPLFLVILFCLRKDLYWLELKAILFGILIFFIILFPLLYLWVGGKIPQYLWKILYMYNYIGGEAMFIGKLDKFLLKAFINFKNNISPALKALFLNSSGFFLYGPALKSPLLIHWINFPLVLFSMAVSLWRRKISDKILLLWLMLGSIGALGGVRFFQARYIVIILVPLLIFIGRFIAEIFTYLPEGSCIKRGFLLFLGIILLLGLSTLEIRQLMRYYYTAPSDLEECRVNSYGCAEAAQYLFQIPDIKNCEIITDSRMTILTYLKYIYHFSQDDMKHREIGGGRKIAYYVLWAPESHPEDYWDGLFRNLYASFKQRYPKGIPIKTIYYPGGLPAIHIFRVEEDVER